MRKLNVEKLVTDFNACFEKKQKASIVENDAVNFACEHGYDEAKTAEFCHYVLGIEEAALTEEEKLFVSFIEKYVFDDDVQEVADVSAEEETEAHDDSLVV